MPTVIGVKFKKVGKVYYFDPNGISAKQGDPVIVETSRGLECGEVATASKEIAEEAVPAPLKKVVRRATEADLKTLSENEKFEKEAFKICEEKIKKHELEMKLVAVEYTFDHSKILFYFSADGRIDVRELVKDLASVFRVRIELRQIGVRDEAKMIGGLGVCGCPLCCASFLESFHPVSINMAKDQGLSLNPTKISGACGRLMCCLKYENEAYQDMAKHSPPVGSIVQTPQGKGTVIENALLKGLSKVRLDNSPDAPVIFPCSECKILKMPVKVQSNEEETITEEN
ncbi:MAG: stage 0 sporulation family protein [Clostridia bacterium]|nr:stage 0 sporulation family protein [Clostridia bacterium]